MDEALTFFKQYAEAYDQALLAKHGAPDAEYREKLGALEQMLQSDDRPIVISGISRPPNKTPEELEASKSRRKKVSSRTLFVVREYKDDLFRAYLSGTQKAIDDNEYVSSVFAQKRGDAWKVIAQYTACVDCGTTGKLNGKKCPECGGTGWTLGSGVDVLGSLGKPIAEKKLTAPAGGASLADYNAS